MDYSLCIICQKVTREEIRCGASNSNTSVIEKTYQNFIEDWERFRTAGIDVRVELPIEHATVSNLVASAAKWHKNCRRTLCPDRLQRKQKQSQVSDTLGSCSSKNTGDVNTLKTSRKRVGPNVVDNCLFCTKPEGIKNVLHSFQKLELTEELRKKAVVLNDSNVLAQLSTGDLVANELKYHTYCFVNFNRRFSSSNVKSYDPEEDGSTASTKVLEEVIGMVEEDLAAGRKYFTLKLLYEEVCKRAEWYNTMPMNRTRLKNAVLQRFSPLLKEEQGFRNEVLLVCSESMKDIVKSSLQSVAPSEECRILSKAALICRREMSKLGSFKFQKDGFPQDCQKNSVAGNLKFLIGLIMFGPCHDSNVENEQSTLTIAQLITFNTQTKMKKETPLPLYIGLLVHSKFRSRFLVDELHRLGLSINYNRAKYLERKLGYSVLQHFIAGNLVCPTELRSGLFSVGAVDNIDHNPSARTCQGSFHGTAVSLFQARQNIEDGVKRAFPIPSGKPGTLKLPDEFTTLPLLADTAFNCGPRVSEMQAVEINEDALAMQQVDSTTADLETQTILLTEIRKEEQWAKSVGAQSHDHPDEDDSNGTSTWAAYHGRHLKEVVPHISALFPLFKDSSTDPRMILHAMEIIKRTVNHLNPDQVPVITGDQPIYAIMKQLQWSNESVRELVVILGGFHTEKQSSKAIGDILLGSGWKEAIVEAGVASSGTAEGILNANHVTRARYAHQVTYVALQKLLHEAHQESEPQLLIDDWLKTGCESPTFAYWILVMRLQATLMTFVRAHREGNFDLYLDSLCSLGELFFATDHYHYARWLPIHVHDMKQLPESLIEEFRRGDFVVNRSNKRFSSIAIDQAHEQLNKKLKGSGGVIGLTQDPVSLINWSVCGPEVSKRLEDFRTASGGEEEHEDYDFFHHDETFKRQSDFISHVNSMIDVIRARGNPFLELGNELVNLDGQVSEDKDSVSLITEKGKQKYEMYVEDVLINRTKPFDTKIKNNGFLLFKAPKKKRGQPRKLVTMKANVSLLGKMFIATQSRAADIDDFFAHEFQAYPPSLADSVEKMYHSKKSDVLACLQNEVEDMQPSDDFSEAPLYYHAVVLDGGALIHSLLPRTGAVTFQNYLHMCFLKQLEMELKKTSILHVVWDSYLESSIKGATRAERGVGVRLKIGPNIRLPKNWSNFLARPENKVELFQYLSKEAVSKFEFPQCDFYITNGDVVLHSGPGNDMTERCDHEEADSRIVVHVLHALKEGAKSVLVRTVDSDVVVILICQFGRFNDTSDGCRIFVSFGTGKSKQMINIGQMREALGPRRGCALPFWFALTGCDSTSSVRGRSKRIAFNVWKNSPEVVTEAMAEIMENPFTMLDLESAQFKVIESFFIALYGGAADTINGQRKETFCHRNQNPEMIPPTQDALLQHCRRAVYQASIWTCAHKDEIHPPDPKLYGWREQDHRLLPTWISIPVVSAACQIMVKCSCKKACGNACGCRKKSFDCTALCKCPCL